VSRAELLSTRVTVIEPPSGWRVIDLPELFSYRDLFWFLTYRAVRTRYAQSALGLSWAVIQPVGMTLVFTVIFGRMLNLDTQGADKFLFYYTALVPWTYFRNTVTEGVQTLIAEKNMISKIYFPRLILPISRVLARLLDLGIMFLLLIAFLVWNRQVPNLGVLMLPVFLVMMVAASTGVGLLLSAMAVQYRDVNYAMGFAVRVLMYASPVIYATEKIPEQFRLLYALNPIVGVIEGFRSALLGTGPMPWSLIAVSMLTSVIFLFGGAMYFRRKERIFADVA
jgi:homopolymeric O-antigen transport system permease protein